MRVFTKAFFSVQKILFQPIFQLNFDTPQQLSQNLQKVQKEYKMSKKLPSQFNDSEKSKIMQQITGYLPRFNQAQTIQVLNFLQTCYHQFPISKQLKCSIIQQINQSLNSYEKDQKADLLWAISKLDCYDDHLIQNILIDIHQQDQMTKISTVLWALSILKIKKFENKIENQIKLEEEKCLQQIPLVMKSIDYYHHSLIMQSLSESRNQNKAIWEMLVDRFSSVFEKKFDSFAFSYSLWSIQKVDNHQKFGLKKRLDVKKIENHILKHKEQFLINELMIALWSLKQLNLCSLEFWKEIYFQKLQKLIFSRDQQKQLNLEFWAQFIQIFSQLFEIPENDWIHFEDVIKESFAFQNQSPLQIEKSFQTILVSFSLHNRGSTDFYKFIYEIIDKKYLRYNLNSLVKVIQCMGKLDDEKFDSVLFQKIIEQLQKNLKKLKTKELVLILVSLIKKKEQVQKQNELIKNIFELILNQIDKNQKISTIDISQICWILWKGQLSINDKQAIGIKNVIKQKIQEKELNQLDLKQILISLIKLNSPSFTDLVDQLIFENVVIFNDQLFKTTLLSLDQLSERTQILVIQSLGSKVKKFQQDDKEQIKHLLEKQSTVRSILFQSKLQIIQSEHVKALIDTLMSQMNI